MKNYIQAGNNLTVPAPANVAAGEGVIVGGIFGIATIAALAGTDATLATEGVYSMPKVAADDFAVGATVYFDDATNLMTETALGNRAVGVAVRVAAVNGATVDLSCRVPRGWVRHFGTFEGVVAALDAEGDYGAEVAGNMRRGVARVDLSAMRARHALCSI